MGTQETSSEVHDVIRSSCANSNKEEQINNSGLSKRKRDAGAILDNPPSKPQRNYNDKNYNLTESSIDTSTDSGSSIDVDNEQIPVLAPNNINQIKTQPPIIITLTSTHTLFTLKDIINKISNDITYKSNGKQLSILLPNKIIHEEVIKALIKINAKFHTYARKDEIKPKIILKGLPLMSIDIINEELI
ncbi:hypothetical protein PV326_013685 [Microctonus aethiopoides]|nr:hypothetical protein PV326_013685 [Microctonus aethiopoides]